LSFAELGRMAGVDKSTVSRVVQKGTIPTQENFIKIIDALQIDIENFVDIPEETDAWVNNEKSIANGVYDLLEDVVPIYDIDILKNNIFLMLEDDIFTYTKNGENHQLTKKHLDILRKHILLSFDTLDAILDKD
jgi:transcriptional regulator with XRE-family HTH domain